MKSNISNLGEYIRSNFNGDEVFSTETGLFKACGFEYTRNPNVKKSIQKEIKRHLDYGKTGKINKKTKKQSNEIEILEIYEQSKPINDKRFSKDSQPLIDYLKLIILNIEGDKISYRRLINDYVFKIDNEIENPNNRQLYYNNYLFDFLKGKINSALRQLHNTYSDDFIWEYGYIGKFQNSEYWEVLDYDNVEYIENMKEAIKLSILAKHNNSEKIPNQWKKVAFRYRNRLYSELNKDLLEFKSIEKCAKVIILYNNVKNTENNTINNYQINKTLQDRMEYYISIKPQYIDNTVVKHHNDLFGVKYL